MPSRYPIFSAESEITEKLQEMGVDVFEPQTRFEETIAQVFDEFSSFVFFEGRDKCKQILQNDLCNNGGSVGELQGGDDSFSIYRVSFPKDGTDVFDEKCKNAAVKLLQEFHKYTQQTKRHNNAVLTLHKIKQYMLGMCDRRTSERCCIQYTSLGNLMFILSFGPTSGQVRHIDNMVPNLQICLYMSSSCPSTIIYEMDDKDGPPVTDVTTLLAFWSNQNKSVPPLIASILQTYGDTVLKSKSHTKYFGFWKTINAHLSCFGKLYQPVAFQLALETDPGTTLLAGGNEVHAGPPTSGPRMFAFAVAIPDPDGAEGIREQSAEFESDDNDGEVQYSPVLLHVDFCCILFSLLDYDYAQIEEYDHLVTEAKHFLIDVLIELIRDYPMREYLRQISEDRVDIRSWLENILQLVEEGGPVTSAVENAVHSNQIFYSPDVGNSKKKKKGRNRGKHVKK